MIWDTAKDNILKKWKERWIERHPAEIGEYSWAFLFERGKQIRAHLFCELWNYLCPERPPCIEIAFVIECIHVASLILDDLPWMDNAYTRRGWQTLHSKFSIRKAILLSHDVLELAYEVGQSLPLLQKERNQMDMWYKWSQTKAKILWYGQWLDLSRTGNIEELAKMKTGVLFECVTESVAIFLGLDPLFWRGWGNTLGILFQWIDDWNDREEDILIQQRNAFNESYDWTLSRYTTLWIKVAQGIGKGWWDRPFGQYLWRYFTILYSELPLIPEMESLHDLHLFFVRDSTSVLLPNSFPLTSDSSMYRGLSFMLLFIPYLNMENIPVESLEDHLSWSLSDLWNKEETVWFSWLEKKPEIKPFLAPLRQLENMVQSVTKTSM